MISSSLVQLAQFGSGFAIPFLNLCVTLRRTASSRFCHDPKTPTQGIDTHNETMAPSQVLPHAMDLPIFRFLKDKRVVLASASPRRKELLETSVSSPVSISSKQTDDRYLTRQRAYSQGLKPDIVPSTFAENLPHGSYSNALAEYPIATVSRAASSVNGAER